MRLTNNFNLPESVFEALQGDDYDHNDDSNTYSATTLLKPSKVVELERRYKDELESDISDRVWSLLGSSVHYVLDNISEREGRIKEQRVETNVLGTTVTGKVDLYDNGVISDYKVTSVWSFVFADHSWEEQLNIYSYLWSKQNKRPESLQVVAILRDWQKSKVDDKYPQLPIIIVPIKQWSLEEQEEFIKQRVLAHKEASLLTDDDIPYCTFKERWGKPSTYAIMKGTNKTATRVLPSRELAEEWLRDNGTLGMAIVERVGDDTVRCKNYCNVAKWCNYAKARGVVSE